MDLSCDQFLRFVHNEDVNTAYVWATHFMSALNVAMTALCSWILVRHTPSEMGTYRWYLLNVALSAFALDIWNTLVYVPVIYVPPENNLLLFNVAIGPLGRFGKIGAQIGFVGFVQMMGSCGISIFYAFVYRYVALEGKWLSRLKRRRNLVPMGLLQLLYSTPVSVFSGLLDDPFHEEMVVRLCCPECGVTVGRVEDTNQFIGILYSFIAVLVTTGLFLVWITSRALRKLRAEISAETYQYQRQLFRSLFLQLSIPCTLIGISYTVLAVSVILHSLATPMVTRLAFLVASSHTTINGAVMLLTIRPYRETLASKVKTALHKLPVAHRIVPYEGTQHT